MAFVGHHLLMLAKVAIRRLPRLSELPDEISSQELWALFGDMEYERLDFKESANYLKDIIPAMAMAGSHCSTAAGKRAAA